MGIDPNISDENGHLLEISGTISLFLRFGSYVIKTDFYVCEQLETIFILGDEVFELCVECLRPREKTVELEDGTVILIVRKTGTRNEKMMNNPEYTQ